MSPDNDQALARLWEQDYPQLRRTAARVLRDRTAAEDAAMYAFVKLGEQMEQGDVLEPHKLVRTILKRHLVDEVRKEIRRPDLVTLDERRDEAAEPGLAGEFLSMNQATFPGDFDAAVRLLPAEERDPYILIELRGLTVREAAEILETPRSTVGDRLQAAHTLIRKELA